MKVTYYALKECQVGDDWRKPGDLIPEACEWAYVEQYVRTGQIAPVLVSTLPQEEQDYLGLWEQERDEKAAAQAKAIEAAKKAAEKPAVRGRTPAKEDADQERKSA